MISFTGIKLYRWFNVLLGARSFTKIDGKSKSYVIVRGDSKKLVNILLSQGWVEEWPHNA